MPCEVPADIATGDAYHPTPPSGGSVTRGVRGAPHTRTSPCTHNEELAFGGVHKDKLTHARVHKDVGPAFGVVNEDKLVLYKRTSWRAHKEGVLDGGVWGGRSVRKSKCAQDNAGAWRLESL